MIKKLAKAEDGQGMVEYVLITVGISLAAISALWLLNSGLKGLFNEIITKLSS